MLLAHLVELQMLNLTVVGSSPTKRSEKTLADPTWIRVRRILGPATRYLLKLESDAPEMGQPRHGPSAFRVRLLLDAVTCNSLSASVSWFESG